MCAGMMDAAYFVGRKELLDFINELLDLKLQKIEQTAPGHIACQMVDMMFPGTIAMSKVNWGARNDYEFVQNYKLLQGAFTKHHVQRHIDVDKLIRAKYQDNLEFMQWFKAFFDQSGADREGYDPAAVRARGKGGQQYNTQFGSRMSSTTARRPVVTAANRPTKPTAPVAPKPVSKPVVVAPENRASRPLRERPNEDVSFNTPSKPDLELIAKNEELNNQVETLTQQVEELEAALLDTEKERDFYFSKSRLIEVLLQVHQETEGNPTDLVEKIFKVLYAEVDDHLDVDEAGEVVNANDMTAEELEAGIQ